ncbi:MAG: hypothetical protein JSS44_08630 [Proteobacteria bacterium]|nr:hypothetical protein [Pseudomonadota bacterium]
MTNEAINEQSIAITQAFRFLEQVWQQIDALQKTLKEQAINASGAKDLGVKISNYKASIDCCEDDNASITRSVLDTFEVHRIGKKGRPAPIAYGGFQISLAPNDAAADEAFFPHVAILLGAQKSCDPWECEEFQLDERYLTTKSDDDDDDDDDDELWAQDQSNPARWKAKDHDFLVARVVPLVELKSEQDTQAKIIVPLLEEIRLMIKAIDSDRD